MANKGFTLIELMIVVAIIAILAALAAPSYVDYLRRGAIPEGLAELSNQKVKMVQFFSDRQAYTGQCTAVNNNGGTPAGKFTITCTEVTDPDPGADTPVSGSYTLTATGSGIVGGFVYTINNTNIKTSTGVWGKNKADCWILRKDGSC